MSSKTFAANARVSMTIEVTVRQGWTTTCTVDQVYEQAGEEARRAVERLLEGRGRIIGPINVTAILAQRENL